MLYLDIIPVEAKVNQMIEEKTGSSEGEFFPPPDTSWKVSQASGIWRVTKDGHFYGDFHAEQDALEAVEVASPSAALPA